MRKRESGLLLHITSLPSPFGIGDLGAEAYKFADFLVESGQSLWQVLPLNPTDPFAFNSPYGSNSSLAGNPLMISPDMLVDEGFDPKFGARPLKRTLQRRILDPLALRLLQGEFGEGDHILADAQDGALTFVRQEPVTA